MIVNYEDFNNAASLLHRKYRAEWTKIEDVLRRMPLHIKASDQAGKQGAPIFDPVGTNSYIKNRLTNLGWASNRPIPSQFDFLGTDVDFVRRGLLVEAQFSNYPFLLNNVIRSELFCKSQVEFDPGHPVEVVIIITKARLFPASNSTLYYEQAVKQIRELARHRVFDAPMRVVGLFENVGQTIHAVWTEYHARRYSRTVVSQKRCRCRIENAQRARSRCRITILP